MSKRTTRTTVGWATAAFLVLSGLLVAAPQPDERTRNQKLGQGAALYRINCQNCHGRSAKGDGTIADLLKVQPTDLTVLARENDSEFPAEDVRRIIDGREEVKAHGRREMPVWGEVFAPTTGTETGEEAEPSTLEEREEAEAEVRRKIDSLILYLESIQR